MYTPSSRAASRSQAAPRRWQASKTKNRTYCQCYVIAINAHTHFEREIEFNNQYERARAIFHRSLSVAHAFGLMNSLLVAHELLHCRPPFTGAHVHAHYAKAKIYINNPHPQHMQYTRNAFGLSCRSSDTVLNPNHQTKKHTTTAAQYHLTNRRRYSARVAHARTQSPR